ncbi:DUF6531 domain-containing protein, partial [Tolypothrix sp. VBCCA 56010]|uniref:DUF6531 domain-containing protein n=1 Tax=Tolypothrix sp. VBCCA 56010 TaxID=3137731 RepID=UPI003D7C40DA
MGGLSGQSNTHTGGHLTRLPMVKWNGRGDTAVDFTLLHGSLGNLNDVFGHGWSHTYEARITHSAGVSATLRMPDGLTVPYAETSGTFTPPAGWYHTLVRNGNSTWTLTFKNQRKWNFNTAGRLSSVVDRNGNTVTVNRGTGGEITSITTPDGRALTFAYTSGRVSNITDPSSRVWSFSYNGAGQLTGVTYPALGGQNFTRQFTYNATHDILTETDLRGNVWSWTYDSSERVTSATDPLNRMTTFAY